MTSAFRYPHRPQDRITVQGIDLAWDADAGTFTFQGLPVAMMWVDTTLAGLLSGVAAMVGAERFSLALQAEGSKSVEADWSLISRHALFRDGFEGIAVVAAVAGWGQWRLVDDDVDQQRCRFQATNTWEGSYQKKLGVCWGSAMLAGKFAGYCTKRFGTPCWATQTAFIAKGDAFDEFVVAPSARNIDAEIERLLSSDLATRADLAASLAKHREAQALLLQQQEALELEVQKRTQANRALEKTMSQLRQLSARLTQVEAQERTRMAHLLHDQLQQSLVAASFSLSSLNHGATDMAQEKALRTARLAVEEALRESKSLVLDLSPPVLREAGLVAAIVWLGQRMQAKHGLTVAVEMADREVDLPQDQRLALFNAIRELLLNVVKHSGVRDVRVTLAVRQDATIQVVVADEGAGFAAQADDQSDSVDSGFGLFAIRERIEAIGGSMTINSHPGQGCSVTLTAPLRSAESAGMRSDFDDPQSPSDVAVPSSRRVSPASATAPIRILLVDDHVIVRDGLRRLLSRDVGIEIVGEAADGETAIRQAHTLQPDLVLMDIGLPKMDGLEATRIIHATFPEMLVIGLSMHTASDRGEAMCRAGASAYVSKSEASEVLVATIHACCGR